METGWTKRVEDIFKTDTDDSGLKPDAEKYIRETFPPSRDRLNTLATTVAAVGTFLLALLAVVVAISAGISTESNKVLENRQAKELLTTDCARKERESAPKCVQLKTTQAQEKLDRAESRHDDVRRISKSQLIAGGLVLLAFLAALGSQLVNPIVPRPNLRGPDLLTDWRTVHSRYRWKRHLIEAALSLYVVAAVTLAFVGLDVLPFNA